MKAKNVDCYLICKRLQALSISALEAAKGLRVAAKLMKKSGVSIKQLMRMFIPKKEE